VPKDEELRLEVIWLYYDVLVILIWREIEDYEVGDKKLLVARSNRRCWKIYRKL